MHSIKHPIVFSAFLFVFSALISSPLPASAAVGDNCQTDLTSGIPDSQDWKGVYIIRGDDGSAWQRGIISSPIDTLLITEGQATDITATVGVSAETAFFIYAAADDNSGVLNKPGEGVCFEGPQGDAAGGVSFPVHARTVWDSLGSKLVVDVFYRMEESWDQLSGQKTNNNFLAGTFMLPKTVTVMLDIPPPSENDLKQPARGAWEAGKGGSSSSAEPGNNASPETGGDRHSVGFACQIGGPGTNQDPRLVARLDPVNIDPSLLGNNFDGTGGTPVEIG